MYQQNNLNNIGNEQPVFADPAIIAIPEQPSSATWNAMQDYSRPDMFHTEEQVILRGGAQPPVRPTVPVADSILTILFISGIYILFIIRRFRKKIRQKNAL